MMGEKGYVEGPLNEWHTDRADEVDADRWNDAVHNLAEARDAAGRNCMDYVTAGIWDRAASHAWQGTAYERRLYAILAGPTYDRAYADIVARRS